MSTVAIPGLDAIRDPPLQAALKSIGGHLGSIRDQVSSLDINPTLSISVALGSDTLQVFVGSIEPACPQGPAFWWETLEASGGRLNFSCQQQTSGVWDWTYLAGTADVI